MAHSVTPSLKALIVQGLKKLAHAFVPIHGTSSPAVASESNNNRINDKVAIVYVHGGAWFRGSPDEINAYKGKFPGIHIESVGYSLLPYATNARQVEEVRDAVSKAKEKFGRVFLMGYSAGAQIAILASRKIDVEGVISISGAVDFSAIDQMTTLMDIGWQILSPRDPYTFAADDATRTLLIHGTDDTTVRVKGAERYQARHHDCTLIEVPGKAHTLELLGIESEAIKTWMNL